MKSERRHELQQNELADFLGRFIKKSEPYAPVAVTAVIVVIVAALSVGYFQSRSATQRSDATLLYLLNAGQADPAALGDIADNYPKTKAAQLARLSQADVYLGQGIEAMFSDRELATTGLQDAVATYEQVLGSAQDEIVRSRAALGLARAHESLGEVEASIEAYEQVIEIAESEAMINVAQQRIESLQSEDTQAFLSWFGEQNPQPAEPSLPPDMPEAGGLPGMPDLELPDFSAASDQLPPLGRPESDEESADDASAADEPSDNEEADNEEADNEEPASEESAGEEPAAATTTEDEAAAEPAPPAEDSSTGNEGEADAGETPTSAEDASKST